MSPVPTSVILAETAATVACIYGVAWWVQRRRRTAASNVEATQSHDQQRSAEAQRAICSFCGKSQDEVRKLIAGPKVYICDECIDLCNDIIAEECEKERSPTSPELSERGDDAGPLAGTPVRCVLCTLPKDPTEIVLIPNRGALCTVCLDAICAVISENDKSSAR